MMTDTGQAIVPPPRSSGSGLATAEPLRVSASGTLDDDIDATRFLRAIARNWILITVITLVFGLGSFAFARWVPTTYEASATLVVSTPRETSGLPRTAATARALLTNAGVIGAALRGTTLEGSMTTPEFVRNQMSIDEVPGGQFVRVRIRASDPNLAAAVTKSLVNGVITEGARVDERAAARAGEELKIQVDRAGERLTEAGQRLLEQYRRSYAPGITNEVQALLSDGLEGLLTGEVERFPPGVGVARRPRAGGGAVLGEAELKQLEGQSKQELELAKLRADYQVARRVYSDIGVRYERSRFDALSGGSLVQLVDPQIAAGTPLPRNLIRKTLLGLVVGLLVAVAFVIVWEAHNSMRRVFVQ